ncbi:MAG: Glycosyl transferase group 1, partial [Microgenomates group bacterium GW2011_GWC1_49_7]
MNLCVVSSFPPKQCGIAEFNQDLMTELLPLLPPSQLVSVAINEGDEFVNGYPADVKLQIRKNYPADYLKAADFINNLKSDVVLLQHQFALFGGFCGGYALDLIRKLDRPVICVVHTVPVRSDAHKPITKKKFFFQAAPKIRQFVVFTPEAKRKLLSYDIASEKITVIDHGAPDILSFKSTDVRHSLGLKPNEFMIFSFGLLQKGKGLDYAIGAMEEMAKQKLNCRLVILATPLRGDENEQYFLKLKSLIKTLHLGQYVLFQRVYLSKEQLYAYINACDIGLLPYVYQ